VLHYEAVQGVCLGHNVLAKVECLEAVRAGKILVSKKWL
jgi:hypothetical protein